MEALWFWLVAGMLAAYVVFDGFDLGTGIVHLFVARTPAERGTVIGSIGPVWDGNEVWLLAAGGTLYFAFPALYASSFSGFYLPLMIVLWLLILRGCAIEFRHHVTGAVWVPFWDVVFASSSLLLALFFGTALGNVVRGVPLDESGRFFVPLWTDLLPGPAPGVLDVYTVLVGLAAVAALALHGALWLALKTDGATADRARMAAGRTWWAVAALTLAATVATFFVQPLVPARLREVPATLAFPALAIAGLAAVRLFLSRRREGPAFLASCTYLVGMLLSAAGGLYPYVLPALGSPALGMTARSAAAGSYGLKVGLVWWIFGMLLVTAYFVFTYRRFAGKSSVAGEAH